MQKLTHWQNQEIWAGNNDRYDSMVNKPRRNNEFYMRGWNTKDQSLADVKQLCEQIRAEKIIDCT